MAKYIDADALMKQRPENFNEQYADHNVAEQNKGWNNCNSYWCKLVDEMPAADAEPVRHGKLTDLTFGKMYNDPAVYGKCSICGAWNAEKDTHYCRNCGAKMDGPREIKLTQEVKL